MARKARNSFTVGELASLFGISKQTLQYYDRIGLLSPAYVSENGYRHYSIDQYLDLDLIVRLRSLQFSLPQIHRYLGARSRKEMQSLLTDRAQECRDLIRQQEELLTRLQATQDVLAALPETAPGELRLERRNPCPLLITAVEGQETWKERIMSYARHACPDGTTPNLTFPAGWMLETKAFFAGPTQAKSRFFFSRAATGEPADRIAPGGLWLTAVLQGIFSLQARDLAGRLDTFLQSRGLAAGEYLYVQPRVNHWLSNDPSAYVTKVFLPVRLQ